MKRGFFDRAFIERDGIMRYSIFVAMNRLLARIGDMWDIITFCGRLE